MFRRRSAEYDPEVNVDQEAVNSVSWNTAAQPPAQGINDIKLATPVATGWSEAPLLSAKQQSSKTPNTPAAASNEDDAEDEDEVVIKNTLQNSKSPAAASRYATKSAKDGGMQFADDKFNAFVNRAEAYAQTPEGVKRAFQLKQAGMVPDSRAEQFATILTGTIGISKENAAVLTELKQLETVAAKSALLPGSVYGNEHLQVQTAIAERINKLENITREVRGQEVRTKLAQSKAAEAQSNDTRETIELSNEYSAMSAEKLMVASRKGFFEDGSKYDAMVGAKVLTSIWSGEQAVRAMQQGGTPEQLAALQDTQIGSMGIDDLKKVISHMENTGSNATIPMDYAALGTILDPNARFDMNDKFNAHNQLVGIISNRFGKNIPSLQKFKENYVARLDVDAKIRAAGGSSSLTWENKSIEENNKNVQFGLTYEINNRAISAGNPIDIGALGRIGETIARLQTDRVGMIEPKAIAANEEAIKKAEDERKQLVGARYEWMDYEKGKQAMVEYDLTGRIAKGSEVSVITYSVQAGSQKPTEREGKLVIDNPVTGEKDEYRFMYKNTTDEVFSAIQAEAKDGAKLIDVNEKRSRILQKTGNAQKDAMANRGLQGRPEAEIIAEVIREMPRDKLLTYKQKITAGITENITIEALSQAVGKDERGMKLMDAIVNTSNSTGAAIRSEFYATDPETKVLRLSMSKIKASLDAAGQGAVWVAAERLLKNGEFTSNAVNKFAGGTAAELATAALVAGNAAQFNAPGSGSNVLLKAVDSSKHQVLEVMRDLKKAMPKAGDGTVYMERKMELERQATVAKSGQIGEKYTSAGALQRKMFREGKTMQGTTYENSSSYNGTGV